MALPLISIVTPSFNQARFIEANIRSVLDQRYPSFEHIIIDGGSTDGTIDVLRRYPHLIWTSEPDRGQSHALNKGFRAAKGEIVGWLNSDDVYCPDALSLVAERFENRDVMVVCGDGFEIDESGNTTQPLYSRKTSPEVLIKYWKWKYEFIQPAFFFRRDVFHEVGYLDESLHYTMDYDFFIRLGGRYTFEHLPKPLACLRLHEESKTGKNIRKLVPDYVVEMHKVSRRYWGTPTTLSYYEHAGSFVIALVVSFLKNVFFVPGSKSRMSFRSALGRGNK